MGEGWESTLDSKKKKLTPHTMPYTVHATPTTADMIIGCSKRGKINVEKNKKVGLGAREKKKCKAEEKRGKEKNCLKRDIMHLPTQTGGV
jgi:predicted ThiF/HesA family dinucleotide-utilizing enzyme